LKSKSTGHGGSRHGAGKPKGHQATATLDKIAARDYVRRRVTDALAPLLDAQLANAIGLKYLVTRHKTTGKFIRVTEAMARQKRGAQEQIIEVWEKDPSVHAFTYLLDRALDRPKEQEIALKVRSGDAEARVARLVAARKRLAKLTP
jgi:hypothetical protein